MKLRTHRDLDIWKEGSAPELETQLIISEKLGFLANEDIFERLERLKSKILGLIRHLKGRKNA